MAEGGRAWGRVGFGMDLGGGGVNLLWVLKGLRGEGTGVNGFFVGRYFDG